MFVSVWIDQHLNFGEHTTNRVESQHAKLKKYLESADSSLDKFVGCIDRMVISQVTTIKESLEKSIIFRIHQHNLHCFRLLHGFVSNEALEIMFEEHKRLNDFQLDSSNCGCRLRNSCGLPCACELSTFIRLGQHIPLDSIDLFWRKLDISPSIFEKVDDISCDGELNEFKKTFDQHSKVGKKSLLRKLKDIIGIGSTDIQEPQVQKNTRGRPSLKKSNQKRCSDPVRNDPRRNSCSTMPNFDGLHPIKEPSRYSSYEIDLNKEPMIDLNEVPDEFESSYHEPVRHGVYEEPGQQSFYQEPAQHMFYQDPPQHNFYQEPVKHTFYQEPTRHSSYQESTQHSFYQEPLQHCFNQKPAQHSSFQEPAQRSSYSFPYTLPSLYHPYITEVQDVDSDGNCGFRAIAVCLGYSQNDWDVVRRNLIQELEMFKVQYDQIFGTREWVGIYNRLNWFEKGINAPKEYWMRMPELGVLISSHYNVILHVLGMKENSTYIPLRSEPPPLHQRNVISIAHVNGNHFVKITLSGSYPVPTVSPHGSFCRQNAAEWITPYEDRISMYTQHFRRKYTSKKIIVED